MPLFLSHSDRPAKIFLIGPFPPPIHGMAFINAMMRDRIISLGVDCIILDTSPRTLNRNLSTRLIRLPIVLFCLLRLFFHGLRSKPPVIYMSVAGGYGQLYDLLFMMIARLLCSHIYLHHHSYAYLHKKSLVAWLLTSLTGQKATHIVACEDMGRRLKSLYSSVLNITTLSGIISVNRRSYLDQSGKKFLKTIGFLSNISIDKGIIEFLDVVSRLEKDDIQINALIAGPFQDQKTEAMAMNRLSKLKSAKYVGPKYGKEKSAFYENIDVLLFPTNYVNESEGLVIHEAMSHRIPVIAKARGCIESILKPKSGLVIKCNEDFVKVTVKSLLSWQMSPDEFQLASLSALKSFLLYRADEEKKFENLCLKIISS